MRPVSHHLTHPPEGCGLSGSGRCPSALVISAMVPRSPVFRRASINLFCHLAAFSTWVHSFVHSKACVGTDVWIRHDLPL